LLSLEIEEVKNLISLYENKISVMKELKSLNETLLEGSDIELREDQINYYIQKNEQH